MKEVELFIELELLVFRRRHSAERSLSVDWMAMRACRSAIFEKNLQNVCKPLNILTRFYECLQNSRSLITNHGL